MKKFIDFEIKKNKYLINVEEVIKVEKKESSVSFLYKNGALDVYNFLTLPAASKIMKRISEFYENANEDDSITV